MYMVVLQKRGPQFLDTLPKPLQESAKVPPCSLQMRKEWEGDRALSGSQPAN